ncbi:MAG: hypothetical protein Kow0025_18090 [Thermodesulfovibrionales bacterium]
MYKKIIALGLIAALALGVFLFLRGPYVSNILKRTVLTELGSALGLQIIAGEVLVNVVPFYVEADEVKAFNENGDRVFAAKQVKAYLNLSGLLRREVDIQRVAVVSPEIWSGREQAARIMENLRRFEERGAAEEKDKKKALAVRVRSVSVKKGGVSFYDVKYRAIATARDIDADVELKKRPEVSLSVGELALAASDWPSLKASLRVSAVLGEKAYEIKDFAIESDGARLKAQGRYLKDGSADLSVGLDLPVRYVKEVLELKEPGEGSITAKGDVRVSGGDIANPFVDLSVGGELHLQTLLEALSSSDTSVLQGPMSFSLRVSGNVRDLKGSGEARLRNGEIYGVKLDTLATRVLYEGGVMRFTDGRARLYGGKAEAEGSISIPRIEPYAFSVQFDGVDSAPALELIKLETAGLSPGKVKGTLRTAGMEFSPEGWAAYEATKPSGDFIGRIRSARADYRLSGGDLALSAGELATAESSIAFGGRIDLDSRALALEAEVETKDIRDLTSPYFKDLKGGGSFKGSLRGTIEDPLVEGRLSASSVAFRDYALGTVEGEVSYEMESLRVSELMARGPDVEYRASGSIAFPGAGKVFDFKDPVFDLSGSARGARLSGIMGILGNEAPVEMIFDSKFTFAGKGGRPVLKGSAQGRDAVFYGFPVQSADFVYVYDSQDLVITDAVARMDGTSVSLSGRLSSGGRYAFKASSRDFSLDEVAPSPLPFTFKASVEAEGEGTFDDPRVTLKASISEGRFKGEPLGGGNITASLAGRAVTLEGDLMNGGARIRGNAELSGRMPWGARVELSQGRYDFLIASFMEEVPEDLMLNLSGTVLLSGDREAFSADAALGRVNLMLYGQSFTNDSEIRFNVDGDKITFSSFVMKSGNATFSVSGGLVVNSSYNVVVEGSSNLAPLKVLSKKIDALRGDAEFVMALQGAWDKPIINGGLSVSEGSLAIRGFPQRFSSITGYAYVDRDRVVIQEFSARSGGGDVELSGIVHLRGFKPQKVSLDALLDNITVRPAKDFVMNVGGNVLFRGSLDSGDVTGEMVVNRARYTERVEWKSWLLKARPRKLPRGEMGWADNVKLNVKVSGSESIVIDNNLAHAPLKIDLVVRGTLASPRIVGRIESNQGKVYFRNNEFDIIHATVDFADIQGISPFVEIVAETDTKGYQIWLSLEGRLDRFDLTLTSDPPLEEVEILSLLTVGEFGGNLSGFGGIGAAEATSFLTGKFQDILEERLTDITGLSRFQIDPQVSETTGTVTPRITVSKRLASDKLFVTYSTAVGSAEEQELKLEYLLGENISLLGVRDERGSIGGDVKFRFRFE